MRKTRRGPIRIEELGQYPRINPWYVAGNFVGFVLISFVLAVVFVGCYTGANFLLSMVSCW